ncbi:hypothetical protein JST97_08735 [bacterium]|nr:hypothetical protein [bacterium]
MMIHKGTPQFGWIRGQFPGGTADLNFNRRQQTISGDSFGDQVQISTSSEGTSVTGRAHGQSVELKQQWSPQLVKLEGWANGARYQMTVDYDCHKATGNAGGQPIDLNFDLHQGFVRGQAGGGQVDLNLSNDGALTGQMAGGRVQAEMVNLDLGHLLSNWFLVTQ